MPALFIGHGSPMNAITENIYTQMLANLGSQIPRPLAILCISAHWMTKGTWVTGMKKPKTIHDFYGFPKELFEIQYPAPGSPETALLIQSKLKKTEIQIDRDHWGLDHGTWAVLKHMYPSADIPVLQLSIFIDQPAEYHYDLGKQLKILREQGILLLASGNIVHNLRQILWENDAIPYNWAIEFDDWVKQRLIRRDDRALVHDYLKLSSGKQSVPTPDHYYPMLYILGAADSSEPLHFEYEELQNGSISMRSFRLG